MDRYIPVKGTKDQEKYRKWLKKINNPDNCVICNDYNDLVLIKRGEEIKIICRDCKFIQDNYHKIYNEDGSVKKIMKTPENYY